MPQAVSRNESIPEQYLFRCEFLCCRARHIKHPSAATPIVWYFVSSKHLIISQPNIKSSTSSWLYSNMETVSYVIWAVVIIFILGQVSPFNLQPHESQQAARADEKRQAMSQPLIHHFANTHKLSARCSALTGSRLIGPFSRPLAYPRNVWQRF